MSSIGETSLEQLFAIIDIDVDNIDLSKIVLINNYIDSNDKDNISYIKDLKAIVLYLILQ